MKSQFYLMENPKEVDISDKYIFHSKSPKFIAQIHSFEEDIDMLTFSTIGENIAFYYINTYGLKELYMLVVVEDFGNNNEKIQSKLKRMADWWTSYLVWEDQQNLRKGGTSFSLVDFNEKCIGLKIIHSDSDNKWLVIYKGLTKVFESEQEMDYFLTAKLNFTDEQLEKGAINKI